MTQAKTSNATAIGLVQAARFLHRAGRGASAVAILDKVLKQQGDAPTLRETLRVAEDIVDVEAALAAFCALDASYARGTHTEARARLRHRPVAALAVARALPAPDRTRGLEPVAGRLLYLLHHALPQRSTGYATRGHGLARAMLAAGMDVVCLTRPGFPADMGLTGPTFPAEDLVDGVRYLHDPEPMQRGTANLAAYAEAASEVIGRHIARDRPQVLMAASNHANALPGLIAARRAGIPFWYEVRGFWEVTGQSNSPGYEKTFAFALARAIETTLMQAADRVFTLTGAMRDDMIARGVDAGRIALLPNATDPDRFTPQPRDRVLAARLNIPDGVPVIGYVGTFNRYEGLDDLARACARLAGQGRDFRLLLVGDEGGHANGRGPVTSEIARIASETGLADRLILPGRVPHDEVERYYSLIDIAPFPRKPDLVCELVSPLKPLEALAMEKTVIVSSVAPLAEMIADGKTGLVFEKGNPDSLTATLDRALSDAGLRARLGEAGRKWVAAERTWATMAARVAGALDKTMEDALKTPVDALSILDEISHLNWSTEFSLRALPREKASLVSRASEAGFLFLESAWKGNAGDWQYAFTSPGLKHRNAQSLVALLDETKAEGKRPIVFWNKEDPLHYDRFLPIAQRADHIFTTDENMVANYRRDTGARSVTVLPFAANLALTNPVNRPREAQENVCFAGSYYSEGHEERARQMGFMLEPIREFSGTIFDRMSNENNPRYFFPEPYRPFIKPAVPFSEMTGLYRRFRVFLNVNTIIDSPSMMSRRVYELLASGTPVVSAPSAALDAQFPDIVQVAANRQEAIDATGRLLTDEHHWNRISHLGVRAVARDHQYRHRADVIRQTVFGQGKAARPPLVTVVVATKRHMFLERILENISRQNYPRMEVMFSLTEAWPTDKRARLHDRIAALPNVERVGMSIFPPTVSLGHKLNAAIAKGTGEYFAKMDDDDFYFDNYLADMIMCFDYGQFDIVGKWSFPVWLEGPDQLILRNPGQDNRISNFVMGPTLVARRTLHEKVPFADRSRGEDTDFLKRSLDSGARLYSADMFNFIYYRSADTTNHTWQADNELFIRTGRPAGSWANRHDWIV